MTKTTRKAAKRPAAKRKTTKKSFAGQEEYFYLINGEYIRNLLELAKTLENISHEAFNHHVRGGSHNDFSKWVRNVLKEPKLAKEINLAENPDKTLIVILKHLLKEKKKR